MEYVNTTPHPITIYGNRRSIADGPLFTVAPSGTTYRLPETVTDTETVSSGVTVSTVQLGNPSLPDPRNGVLLIVSMPLAQGLLAMGVQRRDVVYPYGQVRAPRSSWVKRLLARVLPIKDNQGRILGCRGFGRLVA